MWSQEGPSIATWPTKWGQPGWAKRLMKCRYKPKAAIVFAPAGELVPPALEGLQRGGTLVLAGIHMSSVPALDYQRHLFYERDLRSVTSNTREDGQ